MNLIITDKCTNSCPYCFAAYEMQKHKEQNILTKDDFELFLSFVEKEKTPIRLNVIGGEPLIYPHLEYLLDKLDNAKGIVHSVFFTGGIVSKSVFDKLAQHKDKLSLLFNLNERRSYLNQKHHDIVIRNIEYALGLGIRLSIGYNIFREDFNGEEILDYCSVFGVKDLRFAVACPVYNMPSNMVVPPMKYGILSNRVFQFLKKCFEKDIKGHLDCTLPLCFFTDEQIGVIAKMHPQIISRMGKCGIPIDVNYDLTVFRCFSFSSYYQRRLTDFTSISEIKNYFDDVVDSRLSTSTIKEECGKCVFAERCQGGCLSNNKNFLLEHSKSEVVLQVYSLIKKGEISEAAKLLSSVRTLTTADKFLLAHLHNLCQDYETALKYIREVIIMSKTSTLLRQAKELHTVIINNMNENEAKPSI